MNKQANVHANSYAFHDIFRRFSSLSTCSNLDVDTSKFWTADNILKNMTLEECSCSIGTMECPADAEGMTPPKVQVPETRMVFDSKFEY